jgi:hypothetical protein
MNLRTCSLLWLLLITAGASAQHINKNFAAKGSRFLRFNITSLIDPVESNFSLGMENRFHENWSVGFDAGWIFYSNYFEKTKHANGFILRPALRLYIPDLSGLYLETELHYKYAVYTIEDWLGMNCVNGTAAYEKFTKFHYRKQAYGLHLKTGFQGPVSKNKKLWLEFYLGIGPRWRTEQVLNSPNSCYTHSTRVIGEEPGINTGVAVPMGLRFLYKIK